LSRSLSCGSADEAYALGLFHDCGIPLMMMKYPNYVDVLKQANQAKERCFTDLEDQTFNTNHTTVGFYVAKSWRIPTRICTAILNHHNPQMLSSDDEGVANLLAILKLAETITHSARRLSELPEWMTVQEQILDHLQLSARDFNDLREDMIERLCSSA
jgi:HD-like signal output (HDOD) protein